METKTKKNVNSKIFIGIFIGVVLTTVIILLLLFFNRKYEVTLNYNDGSTEKVLYVKYNTTISSLDVNDSNFGKLLIEWYEVINKQDGTDILSEKPFDFKTKIKKNTTLKAIYDGAKDNVIITFDSRGGSEVNSLTIERGSNLVLPKNPTKSGYVFGNWETEFKIPITNGANLSESITLYAVWIKDNAESSNEVTKKTYYCENGYTLIGTKCSKTEMIEATLKAEKCTNNYTKMGSVCIANTVSSYANIKCPTGTTWNRPGYDYCYSDRTQTDEYTCTNNIHGKYTNGYCYSGSSKEVEYVCPDGFKMMTNYSASTDKSHECHAESATIKSYSCPDGYTTTSGSQCIRVITKNALVK